MVKQLQDEVNGSRKRKEGLENGTYNKVSGCNGVDYESIVRVENGEETDQLNENKDDQVTYNKVSRGENNGDIIKNVVLELSLIHI